MTKTGIVTQLNKRSVCMLTSDGEFVEVKVKNILPSVGEIYSGEACTVPSFYYRVSFVAASILFCILFIGSFYSYYTPVAAITININPSVRLDLNRWNKIIKSTPLNKDGQKLLSSISVKNKSVESALEVIVEQAKKDNFINDFLETDDPHISIEINGKNHDKIDLSTFESKISKDYIKVNIIDKSSDNNQFPLNQKDLNDKGKSNNTPANISKDSKNNHKDEDSKVNTPAKIIDDQNHEGKNEVVKPNSNNTSNNNANKSNLTTIPSSNNNNKQITKPSKNTKDLKGNTKN